MADPLTPAVVLSSVLVHCASAVFHASVHLLGHKTYEAWRASVAWKSLHNHDVARVLHDSYLGALNLVKKHYAGSGTATRAGLESLASLSEMGRTWFPNATGGALFDDEQAFELLKSPSAGLSIAHAIADYSRDELHAPADLVALLRDRFGSALTFSFNELGLKGDERVRAVFFHALFVELRHTSDATLRAVLELSQASQELRAFQGEFRGAIDMRLEQIGDQVQKVLRLQQACSPAEPVEDRLWGYIVVADERGIPRSSIAVRRQRIVIGRDQGDVLLADKLVSNPHLTLEFSESGIVVRDLQSRNGTSVNGAAVDQGRFDFGSRVHVGRHSLKLLSPETARRSLPVPVTVSSSDASRTEEGSRNHGEQAAGN